MSKLRELYQKETGRSAYSHPSRYATWLEKRLNHLEYNLTPSGRTKGLYHGEFHFPIHVADELMAEITVPWVTIREIMHKIKESPDESVQ